MITMKEEFLNDDKTLRAVKLGGYEALAMWLALKLYVSVNLTDGFIPDEDIDTLPAAPPNGRDALEALVNCGRLQRDGTRGAGLVDPVENGWQLHDYLDHATSAEREEERRRLARERKARQRERTVPPVTRPVPRDVPRDTSEPSRVGHSESSRPVTSDLARADAPTPSPRDLIQPKDDDPRPDRLGALAMPAPSSSSSSPETPSAEDADRELPCPLDLASRFTGYPELARRFECTEAELRAAADEFVGFWTCGGGANQPRSHWARRLREDLRRKFSANGDLRSKRPAPLSAPTPRPEERNPTQAELAQALEEHRRQQRALRPRNDPAPRPGPKSVSAPPPSSGTMASVGDLMGELMAEVRGVG